MSTAPRAARSVASVLPFLLLQPLRRIGYLDALAATFAAAGRTDQLPAFATALAYKVLAPPERGWRRDPRAIEDAATFAGLDEPLPESALTTLAEDAAAWTSPLDSVIARAVLAGHDPARPLLVVAHERDQLLVEPDGLFPIAWNAGIARCLSGCRAPIVVSAGAADRLGELVGSLRVVTDAPPMRGETWVRDGRRAVWTNDLETPESTLARTAAVLELGEDVHVLADELTKRRAVLFGGEASLDRSLALAAGAALGAIADSLWRQREATSPLLGLQRLADLSGVLRRRDNASAITLPLGARRRDLERAGWLGALRVPWLGELVLGGGG